MNKKKIFLIFIIILFSTLIYYFGFHRHLTFQQIKLNADYIQNVISQDFILSWFVYIFIYIFITSLLIPPLPLTLAGGYFFGTVLGGIATTIGATFGATFSFLIVRYLIGKYLQKRYAFRFQRFNEQFQKNGVVFLLTSRLIPLIPFLLTNVFAGLTKVPLKIFMWTTIIGMIPPIFVFSYAGKQLASLQSASDVFSLKLFLAFGLLAFLALIPALLSKATKKVARIN